MTADAQTRDVLAVASPAYEQDQSGRPPEYTEEVMLGICSRIADGDSLIEICKEPGMPARATFFRWVAQRPGLIRQYAFALFLRGESYHEEILAAARNWKADYATTELAEDNGETSTQTTYDREQHASRKLLIETLFRLMESERPKKYNDFLSQPPAEIEPPKTGDEAKEIKSPIIENDPMHNAINAWRKARGGK